MSNIILPGNKKQVKKSRSKRRILADKMTLLERELNSAKCMLWAAIKTAGGQVDIPKSTMEQLDGDNILEATYDPKNETTILKARMKGDK